MTLSSPPPGIPSRLPDCLHRHLNAYALAASAAGVSLLALAAPSAASVVYTKTYKVIEANGVYPLDLNHDGTIDFLIQENGSDFWSSGYNALAAKEAFGNAVKGSRFIAAAMKKGAPIGSLQQFTSSTGALGEVMFEVACSVESGCSTVGKWKNVTSRYLGLKFKISGKTHYGWARLSVEVQGHAITATLTGYAYETIVKKEILAGQIASTDARIPESAPATLAPTSLTSRSSSLGRLARGAQSMPRGSRP